MKKKEYREYHVIFKDNKKALSKYLDIYNAMTEDYIPESVLYNHIEQLAADEHYRDIPNELRLKLINIASELNTSTGE